MRAIGPSAIAIAITSFGLLWIEAPQQTWRTWRISKNTGTTIGAISKLDCANHNYLSYSFQVEDRSHFGGSPNFQGNCRDLRNGQSVRVHYDKDFPATTLATFDDWRGSDVSSMLRAHIIVGLVALFFPSMVIIVTHLIIRKRAH